MAFRGCNVSKSKPTLGMMPAIMTILMGGLRTSSEPEPPTMLDGPSRRRAPAPRRTRPEKKGDSTNDLVVCRRCGAQCEPGKTCGARANAIFNRWKKIDDFNFDCLECREVTTT